MDVTEMFTARDRKGIAIYKAYPDSEEWRIGGFVPWGWRNMNKRIRTSFENALNQVLEHLIIDEPTTLTEIANETNIDRRTILRVVDFVVDTQGYFAAEKVTVFGGKGSKVVLIDDRVDLNQLPESVREWYINKRYFVNDIETAITDNLIDNERKTPRVTIEDAILRVFRVLELEDEITVRNLAKHASINRKTADRALRIILEFQDRISSIDVSAKGNVLLARRRVRVEELDETRMKILLTKRYFPEELELLSDEGEKSLMRLA
jgi:predicted transcriptional regulator